VSGIRSCISLAAQSVVCAGGRRDLALAVEMASRQQSEEKEANKIPANADVLIGCSKCRYCKGGCATCRANPFMWRKPARWQPEAAQPQTLPTAPTYDAFKPRFILSYPHLYSTTRYSPPSHSRIPKPRPNDPGVSTQTPTARHPLPNPYPETEAPITYGCKLT
jgi:hypothetical protein